MMLSCEYMASSWSARMSNRRHVASSDPVANAKPLGKNCGEERPKQNCGSGANCWVCLVVDGICSNEQHKFCTKLFLLQIIANCIFLVIGGFHHGRTIDYRRSTSRCLGYGGLSSVWKWFTTNYKLEKTYNSPYTINKAHIGCLGGAYKPLFQLISGKWITATHDLV